MKFFKLLLCALFVVVQVPTQHASAAEHSSHLQEYLQNHLCDGDSACDRASLRFLTATVDLNGDGKPETIVYLLGQEFCGSGGCSMLVLRQDQNGNYMLVTESTITRLPIRILTTSTNGWKDLGVTVARGGIRTPYEARLPFNGKKYPSNPTVSPAKRLPTHTPGTTLIPLDADAKANPVYPDAK